jgi:hypothetical protein
MEYQAERDYLDMVERGMDPGEALIEINRRNRNIARAKEIKASLFADDAQDERQTSGRLTTTNVMQAIETEKKARKRRLRKVQLECIPVDEGETTITPIMHFKQNGYHAVIERGRAFSLKINDSESSTMSLMTALSERCHALTGHWPTCILVSFERLLKLNEASYDFKHFITKDKTAIPFACAEDDADYDVMVVYDDITEVDEWMKDRKSA